MIKKQNIFVESVIAAIEEKKAEAVVTFDLQGKSAVVDFILFCTGRSDVHIDAIMRSLREEIKSQQRVHGSGKSGWVIVDLGNTIVHIMSAEMREYYKMEELWGAVGG